MATISLIIWSLPPPDLWTTHTSSFHLPSMPVQDRTAQTDIVGDWMESAWDEEGPGAFPLLTALYIGCMGFSAGIVFCRCFLRQ